MYQNAVYTCISCYGKICWFAVRTCWYQQNSKDVLRDLYNFWIFFRRGIIVPSFIIAGYVRQILRGLGGKDGTFCLPHIRE